MQGVNLINIWTQGLYNVLIRIHKKIVEGFELQVDLPGAISAAGHGRSNPRIFFGGLLRTGALGPKT
jgi:hypothetical protein